MRERNPRRTRSAGARRRRAAGLLLSCGIITIIVMFAPQLRSIWQLAGQIRELEAMSQRLEQRHRELEALERRYASDEMVEKLAREQLGMVRPGEKVIVPVIPEAAGGQ